MKSIKKGIGKGVTAFVAVETFLFLFGIEKALLKDTLKKLKKKAKANKKEAQDAEKKEEAAEERNDI